MAKIFRIENPAPSMGDQEAQWLVDNFDVQFEAHDGAEDLGPQAHMIRISRDDLHRYKYTHDDWEKDEMTKHMVDCLTIMLNKTAAKWVDLLVWW